MNSRDFCNFLVMLAMLAVVDNYWKAIQSKRAYCKL